MACLLIDRFTTINGKKVLDMGFEKLYKISLKPSHGRTEQSHLSTGKDHQTAIKQKDIFYLQQIDYCRPAIKSTKIKNVSLFQKADYTHF